MDGFQIIGKRDKLEQYRPPTNCDDLYEKWSKALEELNPKDQESQTAKDLLTFILGKLYSHEPLRGLPKDISEKIMSQNQRDAYCEEMGKNVNGQRKMMNMVNAAHHLADNIQAQVENLAENPRNLKFSRRQMIDVHSEDIQLYHYEEDCSSAKKDIEDPLLRDEKHQQQIKKDGQPPKNNNDSCSAFERATVVSIISIVVAAFIYIRCFKSW